MEDVQDAIHCTNRVLAALGDIWPTAKRCGELYKNLCANVLIVETNGAVQGVSNNIMSQLDSMGPPENSGMMGMPEDPPLFSGNDIYLSGDMNDSMEDFEKLGWTLGGFQS